MTAVAFTVFGVAAPAGSKKAFTNRKTGRPIITDDSKRSRPWKLEVAQAAGIAMGPRQLLQGPLELHVRFYQPRPKAHFGTGRNEHIVKPTAPLFPTTKPDTTKLVRAVEDAMTAIVWRDDAQITVQHAEKHYGEPARAVIAVAPIHTTPTQGGTP